MAQMPKWENLALFLLRLALGIIFIMHGVQKIFGAFGGPGLEPTVKHFTHLGIPPVLAYLAVFTEFLGGVALVLGVLTRLAALGIAAVMGVAIWKVHWAHGFFMNWSCRIGKHHGFEYNLALLAMALALALMGGGEFKLNLKMSKGGK